MHQDDEGNIDDTHGVKPEEIDKTKQVISIAITEAHKRTKKNHIEIDLGILEGFNSKIVASKPLTSRNGDMVKALDWILNLKNTY